MRIFYKILFLIVLGFEASSQQLPNVILSEKLNNDGKLIFTNQTLFFVDSTRKITLKEIDKQRFILLDSYQFQPKVYEYFSFGYWLKFSVENPTNQKISALFSVDGHKELIVYRKIQNRYVEIGKGNQTQLPNERPFRYDERYIPLTFDPNETYDLLVFLTKQPNLYLKIEPQLVSFNWEYRDKVRSFFDEYFYLMFNGFYLAVLFFVGVYVLILYFIERRIYYLYYGLYLIFLLLFGFWSTEHSPYFRFFQSYFPILKFTSNNNMYVLISNIFYYLFIREFLEVEKIAKRLNKVILIFVLGFMLPLLAVDVVANFVIQNHSFSLNIWLISQPIIAIFGIYGTIEIFRLKGALARYIKLGTLALLIGALIGFAEQLWLPKPTNFVIFRLVPSIAFDVGVLIEILFFTTALGYKSFLIQREQNSLLKAVKESELQTLRSQINPHFIFNSLNSIKSYILKHKPKEAAEYLTDFSTLMRSILQYSKEQLIGLSDELETTLLYIKLEQLRFEDNFEFIYECDETIDTAEVMIPPLLLQPYIENAIKHGLMNKEGKRILQILVKKHQNFIEITIDDNGIGRQRASQLHKNTPKHQSMGMNINKERIELLNITNDFDIKIEIIDKTEGTKVRIDLPID